LLKYFTEFVKIRAFLRKLPLTIEIKLSFEKINILKRIFRCLFSPFVEIIFVVFQIKSSWQTIFRSS